MARLSLKKRVGTKIYRSKKRVFCRKDFVKLSGYDQVGRALKGLTDEGRLIRVGYGLYAKARISRISSKPILDGGFDKIARESLDRLKVKYEPGRAMKAYLAGSTQIPMKSEVQVKGRFSRRISYKTHVLRVRKLK